MKYTMIALLALLTFGANAQASHQRHPHPQKNVCAVVSSEAHMYGDQLVIENGDQMDNLRFEGERSWDNIISSLKVKVGCSLTTYQYLNFDISYDDGYPLRGFIKTYSGNRGHHYNSHHGNHHGHRKWSRYELSHSWENDRISSLMCSCR